MMVTRNASASASALHLLYIYIYIYIYICIPIISGTLIVHVISFVHILSFSSKSTRSNETTIILMESLVATAMVLQPSSYFGTADSHMLVEDRIRSAGVGTRLQITSNYDRKQPATFNAANGLNSDRLRQRTVRRNGFLDSMRKWNRCIRPLLAYCVRWF